jgi:hypothetical protein
MIKKILSLWLLNLLFVYSFATTPPEIKFGKVSKEELSMQYTTIDSSAAAVVLADFGHTKIDYLPNKGFQLVFTRHCRIKVFTPSGYDQADVMVPLYHDGGDRESISQIKGYTYNLENGKVVKTKLKNEGKFLEEYDDNIQIYKFTLPNVKEGSVLEYSYRISSDFLFNLQDWEFQADIPTIWSEYQVEIPEYFVYKPLSQGYYPFVINDISNTNGTFNIIYRTERTGGSLSNPRTGGGTRQEQVSYRGTKYHWAAQNVPALIEEPFVTTMEDYRLKMEMELASIQFPGKPYENFTTSWEEIDEQLLESDHFGDVFKRTNGIESQVASVIAEASTDTEKLTRIYRYVQQNIRWNQYSRKYADQLPRKTLEEKSGNSADINLLLVAMLREAGISAHPVVLSTRSHGMLRKSFPMLKQFNYVVAMATTSEGSLLLDPTDATCPPGMLPIRCLNQEGRIVSEEPGNKWVSLTPTQGSNEATMATLTLEDGTLSGTISSSRSGYNAMRFRRNVMRESGVDGYLAKLKENQHSWQIQDYEVGSLEVIGKPLKETYEVVLQETAQQAGDMIYLQPIIIGRMEENPFKSEHRVYPVDYPYPDKETFMLSLTIPEGYQVDELPEDIMIALPEQAGLYSFTTKQIGNMLQVVSRLHIDRVKFYAQEYPYLREFFNMIVAKQQEQIVLKRN